VPERSLPPPVRNSQLAVGRLHLKKNLTLVGWISRSFPADREKSQENVGLGLAPDLLGTFVQAGLANHYD